MTLQTEKVGHKDLTGGTSTILHSHPGGGSNEIKIGQSVGAKGATVQVDFAQAFTGVPKVSLTPWSAHIASLVEVTVSYFKWTNDSKSGDVTVDWLAIYV